MEVLVLIILYYLSQNPDFEQSVKPLLSELKNSQQALNFLEELSRFSKLFSCFSAKKEGDRDASTQETTSKTTSKTTQSPASSGGNSKAQSTSSPTAGIADGFIEELLEKYFNSRTTP